MVRTFLAGLFARAPRTSRKTLVSRLALESLETREVPAALTWAPQNGSQDFYTASNWYATGTTTRVSQAPLAGDDVTFDGLVSDGICNDLGVLQQPPPGGGGNTLAIPAAGGSGSTTGLNSLNLINNYSGTVDIVAPLQVVTFNLNAASTGSIAQTDSSSLTVTGTVTWTNGILNSTPDNANVYFNGGGAINLPPSGIALNTGSTLNFGNSNPNATTPVVTTISGAGNLILNGNNPTGAIFVQPNAGVVNAVNQNASVNFIGGPVKGMNTLTIAAKSYWGYNGTGSAELDLQVVNNGGNFFVGTASTLSNNTGLSTVTVALKPSQGAAVSGYTQTSTATAVLEIGNGSALDVSKTKGVTMSTGFFYITPNKNLKGNQQTSTLTGNFVWSGGSLGFPGSPVTIGTPAQDYYSTFVVNGNVTWSGGSYVPGIDCRAAYAGRANAWNINGTLSIDLTGATKPTVVPSPQNANGQPVPKGTWPGVITATKGVTGGDPRIGAGYTLKQEFSPDKTMVIGYDIVV